jgi:hypothetical protein
MSPTAIQEQVNIIKLATEKALQSKEAAFKFLVSAGIISQEKDKLKDNSEEKEKK